MIKNFIIVVCVLCFTACRIELSSQSLNKKFKAEKVDKVLFTQLPVQVKDTISSIFEQYIIDNPTPCQLEMRKMFRAFIDIDSNYLVKNERHVNRAYWDNDARFWERNGTTFSINTKKFYIPINCPYIINMTTFQGQLFLMGEISKKHERVFDCEDPNYLRIHYEDYYYWVVDLEE